MERIESSPGRPTKLQTSRTKLSAPQGIFWFVCKYKLGYFCFSHDFITELNRNQALKCLTAAFEAESWTVALQQVCFPSSPTLSPTVRRGGTEPSALWIHVSTRRDTGAGVCRPSGTRCLNAKTNCKRTERALAKFQFRLAAPSLAT